MIKRISFTVYGVPAPKLRPRFARRGNFVTTYTPAKTQQATKSFQEQALKYKPESPLTTPLSVSLIFYKLKPKSYPKKRNDWITKPDLDNMIKQVLDSMNKIFWNDDAQIVRIDAMKMYGPVPSTHVTVCELERGTCVLLFEAIKNLITKLTQGE